MPYPFVGDIDMTKVHFGPFLNIDNKQRVELHKDNTATKSNKLVFNLCDDPSEPFACRFRLDTVRDDQDGSRRGLIVKLEDPAVLNALTALDDAVVAAAMRNSKEWFKKTLTEAEIRLRYTSLVYKPKEEDLVSCTKFKVKCKMYPTKLHLLRDDGKIVPDGGTLDDISYNGAMVAPILSAYGLWFMGGGSSFGVTIQAEEMVVKPGSAPVALSNFCASKRSIELATPANEEARGENQGENEGESLKKRKLEDDVKLEDDDDYTGAMG